MLDEIDQFAAAAPEGSAEREELRERAANTRNVNTEVTTVPPIKSQATDAQLAGNLTRDDVNIDPLPAEPTAIAPAGEYDGDEGGRQDALDELAERLTETLDKAESRLADVERRGEDLDSRERQLDAREQQFAAREQENAERPQPAPPATAPDADRVERATADPADQGAEQRNVPGPTTPGRE